LLAIPDLGLMLVKAKLKNDPNSMDDNDRCKIVHAIIRFILWHQPNKRYFCFINFTNSLEINTSIQSHIRLSKLDYKKLAKLIVDAFPGEKRSCYYNANNKTRATGKLFDAHRHTRNMLCKSGVVAKSSVARSSK
jgi:hypothetical protein